MTDKDKGSYSDNIEKKVQRNQFKIGLAMIWIFGAYLGLFGLQLVIIEREFIAGVPLILTALILLPPPAGISNILEERLGIRLTIGSRIGVSILLLFIAWFRLNML